MSSYMSGNVLPSFMTTTPWQAKLAAKLYDVTGDGSLKSFFGAQGWNTGLIDDLNKFSKARLLPGADRITYMKANAKVSENLARAFIDHLPEYEGKSVREGVGNFINTLFNAVENAGKGIGDTAKTLPILIGILAVGVAGYLIYAGKKGTKLTPF